MASSNRHWPSMFKSKPCNNQPWSHHHEKNPSSNNSPFSSGGEERSTPEPKPRWNPKPEQIRILEAVFNSGMVNPPRDEIRRIRTQIQEYGQVGDANVFYWFQNRKSRSKNKARSLQAKTTATATTTATSSSSSSSDKNNSPNNNSKNNSNMMGGEHFGNSPTSVNQQCNNNYFNNIITPLSHHHSQYHEFVSHEPIYFPLHQNGASVIGNNNNFSQGLCFSNNNNDNIHHDSMMNGADSIHVTPSSNQSVGGFSSLLLGEMFNGGVGGGDQLKRDEVEKFKFQQELSFLVSTPNTTTCTLSPSSPVVSTPTSTAISTNNLGQILGVGDTGGMAGKMLVFINGVAIEVPSGLFNVKEEFGDEVMLVHSSSGQAVETNEWGVTLNALQHGASYYLVGAHVVASPLFHKPTNDTSLDLLASELFPYQI